MLGRYAIERFLYRLGRSPYRDKFAVKGATLFTLWTGHTHRPTKDLDLLAQGSSAIGDVEQTIRGIYEIQEEDGLVFDSASVEGTKIKEDDEYDGVRIKLLADLAGARIPNGAGAVTLNSRPSPPCSPQASLVAFSDRLHQME